MTTELETKKPVSMWKLKVLTGITTGGLFLVSTVSAETMNLAAVTDIIADVTLLFPALVATVVAAIPIAIIVAVAAMVTGLLGKILGKI